MYSPILGKGVFSGVFLYRRVNTCYRCYGHASPARKLSVPEKCVSAGSDAIRHTRGGRRTNAEETQCPPWTWSPRSEPEPSKRPVNDEWRSSRTNFPCPERKPLRGAFIRSLGANASHGGWGVPRVVWVRPSWHAHGRSARTNSHVRNESRSISKFRIRSNSGAPPPP